MYQVEFTVGKVTELATNVITESMYAQCNSNMYEYLLLDTLVDYQKDNEEFTLSEKQITVWGRPVTHIVHCTLSKLLPVEARFYLMEKTA